MKKEEVLAKSRAEGNDEMVSAINKQSFQIGTFVIVAACLFFAATKVITGTPFFEFPAILFAYLSGMNFYSFLKLKVSIYFVAAFSFTFAFICMTILYFLNW